ncbi:MAG TPA: serine/threonine-protein kinase [Haliangiales bacterium]|nr:serine/threonine-protein kinase [Haliangiales bacterium]
MGETRRAGELPPLPQAKDAPANDPLIGEVIGDRYRVLDRIGAGGMAAVYRCEHMLLRKPVAIKVLHHDLDKDPQVAPRFEREAIAAARLDHPNCVSITDFGRMPDGRMYLVMEFLDGTTLSHIDHPIEWPRAVELTRQILRGLAHAHETGIVHRDLKPGNVMVVRHGDREVAKIIDFGIAKIVEGAAGPHVETQAGIVFGTADFIAPERLVGQGNEDPRSDLYAVGVILYELLTGVRPFHTDDPYETVKRALSETARPPSTFVAGIPVALDVAVLRSLEKNPDRRYASAYEFLKALDPLVKRVTTRSFATRARLPRRFRWWWVGAAAAVGVLVLALAMGGGSKSAPLIRAAEPIDEVARLVKRAAEGDTPGERQSAFDRLVALGHSDKVPWVPMLARDLQELPTCAERREVVAKMRKVNDPDALPYLEKAIQRDDNTCLIDDARATMAQMSGDNVLKKKAPPRRSSGGGHF